jgi:colanic acid/amylovoran biosynthesis glycosyltransferase
MKAQNIIIYRDVLLPYSETFILGQAGSLTQYTPYYIGTSTKHQLETSIPSDRQFILENHVSQPSLWKMLYKLGGIIPKSWLKAVKVLNPSLIHAHFGLDGEFAQVWAQCLKIPLIITFHGFDATWRQDSIAQSVWYRHWLDIVSRRGQFFRDRYLKRRSHIWQNTHTIIAVSDFVRQQLIDKGCPSAKILTHYIGIDLTQFQPDPHIPREPIILFVGRLVEKKGCQHLLVALSKIKDQVSQVRLVIIGDGPLRTKLEATVHRYHLPVEFLGRQSPDQVKNWMNRAQVFCVPSVVAANGDAEGLGMVFLEAQAMELPVVSFASGGIPEAVADGETGFLVPEKDETALGKALLKVLKNPDLGQRLGKTGRQRIATKFDIKQQTTVLEGIYDRILAEV